MPKRKPSTDIGYGKPPATTQLKRDSLVIPKDAPKGRSASLHSCRNWRRNASPSRKTEPASGAIKQLFNRATTGDQRAIKLVADLMNRHPALPEAAVPRFTLTDADREVLTLLIARARHQDDGDKNAQ